MRYILLFYAGQGQAAKMWFIPAYNRSEAQSKAARIYGNICWTRRKVARAELLCLTEKVSLSRPQSPTLIAINLGLLPLPEASQSTCVCRRPATRRWPQGPLIKYLVVFSFVSSSGCVCWCSCLASRDRHLFSVPERNMAETLTWPTCAQFQPCSLFIT